MRACTAPGCDKPLEQRRGETPLRFARRKTCAGACWRKLADASKTITKIVPGRCCATCRKIIERRSGEPLRKFAKRKTCGGECARQLNSATHMTTEVFARNCLACGSELKQRDNEFPAEFMKRKTCGEACGHKLATKHPASGERHCVICGEILTRRRGEKLRQFALRKNCGLECGHKSSIRSRASTTRVTVVDGRCCLVCGEVLERHPKEDRSAFMERKLCNKKCANELTRRRAPTIDFYGVHLPVKAAAKIIGMSLTAFRSRQRRRG